MILTSNKYYSCFLKAFLTLSIFILLIFPSHAEESQSILQDFALNGHGELPDLQYVMLEKPKLRSDVAELLTMPFEEFLDINNDIEGKIFSILYQWAGSENMDPDERGPNIDARSLDFLEKFNEKAFTQKGAGGLSNPLFWSAGDLIDAMNIAYNMYFSFLLMQGPGSYLFNGNIKYDTNKGGPVGIRDLNHESIEKARLVAAQLKNSDSLMLFWSRIFRTIHYSKSLQSLSVQDRSVLNMALESTGANWDAVFKNVTIIHPEDRKGSAYAEDVLGVPLKDNFISMFKEARKKSDERQVVLNSLATAYIKKCCIDADQAARFLMDLGFEFVSLSHPDPKYNNFKYPPPRQAVYSGAMTTPMNTLKKKLFMPYDFYNVMLFISDGQISWVGAYLQREQVGR